MKKTFSVEEIIEITGCNEKKAKEVVENKDYEIYEINTFLELAKEYVNYGQVSEELREYIDYERLAEDMENGWSIFGSFYKIPQEIETGILKIYW